MCVQNKTAPLRGLCITTSEEWGCARCARGHHFHWLLTARVHHYTAQRSEVNFLFTLTEQLHRQRCFFFSEKKTTTNCRSSCVKRSGIAKNTSRCPVRTLYLTEPWSHARACWWKVNSRVLRQTAGEVKCSERAFRCSLIRLLVVRSHWE